MDNGSSFFIFKFQDLSNGILKASFGLNLILALLSQKFLKKINFKFKVKKMFKSVGTSFLTLYRVVKSWNIIPTYFQVSCFLFGFKPKIKATTMIQSYLKSYASTWEKVETKKC
jgi:hypothetical protein